MGYLTDEQAANEALTWWGRYPDSIEALVSLSDDAASDEHGNVIGHVEWQYHPALKIMLAGTNGLVYSTRHAKRDSGWHKFYVIDAEKETQRILKRRLQASNKATKMNTQSNETGSTDMTTQIIQHYAVEYTPNENEGGQLDYIEASLWYELASKSQPEDITRDGDTIILWDNHGLYYK